MAKTNSNPDKGSITFHANAALKGLLKKPNIKCGKKMSWQQEIEPLMPGRA
jgi:hypothetical protein